ncbi:MAG: FAD-binding protein, partial [Candidatus Omnitrophica bacterium]|nr:FAD-binding protein [Candidatus Omnitrophota bacterium]
KDILFGRQGYFDILRLNQEIIPGDGRDIPVKRIFEGMLPDERNLPVEFYCLTEQPARAPPVFSAVEVTEGNARVFFSSQAYELFTAFFNPAELQTVLKAFSIYAGALSTAQSRQNAVEAYLQYLSSYPNINRKLSVIVNSEIHRTGILSLGRGGASLGFVVEMLKANPDVPITIAFKGGESEDIEESANTPRAQGGAAANMPDELKEQPEGEKKDSPQHHAIDTILIGDFLNKLSVVQDYVCGAPLRLKKMMERGADFDRKKSKNGKKEVLNVSREGGYSGISRIVKADGAATGREIQRTLTENVDDLIREGRNIQKVENFFVLDLLTKDTAGGEKEVLGAVGSDLSSGKFIFYLAEKTVVGMGGGGRVFPRTTNSPAATGDGHAVLLRAGAKLTNMHLIQIHPTALYLKIAPQDAFLISEAVRNPRDGKGARLCVFDPDGDGNPVFFMRKYDPDKLEMAERYVVSLAILQEMKDSGKPYVYLSIPDMEDFKEHFGNLYEEIKKRDKSFDEAKRLISIAPAAHYTIGGAPVDKSGRSLLKRLFVLGESAYTGLHGAERMASNSLSELLQMAFNAAMAMKEYVFGKEELSFAGIAIPEVLYRVSPGEERPDVEAMDRRVGEIMQGNVWLIRNKEGLTDAKRAVEEMREKISGMTLTTRRALELRNKLDFCRAVILCALYSEQSIGPHRREDFPDRDYKNGNIWLEIDEKGLITEVPVVIPVKYLQWQFNIPAVAMPDGSKWYMGIDEYLASSPLILQKAALSSVRESELSNAITFAVPAEAFGGVEPAYQEILNAFWQAGYTESCSPGEIGEGEFYIEISPADEPADEDVIMVRARLMLGNKPCEQAGEEDKEDGGYELKTGPSYWKGADAGGIIPLLEAVTANGGDLNSLEIAFSRYGPSSVGQSTVAALKAALKKNAVYLTCHAPHVDIVQEPENMRVIKETIEFASRVGARAVTMHLTIPGKLFADRVLPLVLLAERKKVVLSIENVHTLPIEPNAAWHSADDMNRTFSSLFEVLSPRERKYLGMTLDLGHAWASPQGAPDKFLRELDMDIPIAVVHAHESVFLDQMTKEIHLPLYWALWLNDALEEVLKILIEERGFSEVFILEYESTPKNIQRVAARDAAFLNEIIQRVLNNDGGNGRYKMSVPFEVWNNKTRVMEKECPHLSRKELAQLGGHTLRNFILPPSGAVYVGNRTWKTFSLFPEAEAEVVIENGRVTAVRIIRDKEGRPVLDRQGNECYFIIGRDRHRRVYPTSIGPSPEELDQALEEAGGVIKSAIQLLGITEHLYRQWKKDPKYSEVIERHKAAVKANFDAQRVPDEVIMDCIKRSNSCGKSALALLQEEGYEINPNTFKTRVRRLRRKLPELRDKETVFKLSEGRRSGDSGKTSREEIKKAMRENGFRTNEALRHLCSNGKLISRGAMDTAVWRLTTSGEPGYDKEFAVDYNKNRLTVEEVVLALKNSDYNPHEGFERLKLNGKRITYDAFYAWVKKLTNPGNKYYDDLLTQKYNEWKKNSLRNECSVSVKSSKCRKRPARAHTGVGDEKKADYPAECRILPRPIGITPCFKGGAGVHSCENAEGILPVSYGTELRKTETTGFDQESFILFRKELDEKIDRWVIQRAFKSALSHLNYLRSVHRGSEQIQAVIDNKEVYIWKTIWDAADTGFISEYLINLSYSLPYGAK